MTSLSLPALARQRSLVAIYLCLVAGGVAISLRAPLLPLFADQSLGVTTGQLGFYFTCTGLGGIIVNILVGRLSDALASRRLLIAVTAAWVAAGFASLALVDSYTGLLLTGLLFFSFISVPTGQLLALGREMVAQGGNRATGVVGSLRSGYSLGYVVGPVAGTAIAAVWDIRAAFLVGGISYLVVVLAGVAGIGERSRVTSRAVTDWRAAASRRNLHWFSLAIMLVLSADILRLAFLALFTVKVLNASSATAAAVFSIAPVLEVPLLPLCGIAASRWGSRTVVLAGGVAATAELAAAAAATAVWQLALAQVLHAFMVAALIGVGVGLAQELAGDEVGLGTGIFFASQTAANVVGSSVGGLIGEAFGLRWMFGAAAGWAAMGVLILVFLVRNQHERT